MRTHKPGICLFRGTSAHANDAAAEEEETNRPEAGREGRGAREAENLRADALHTRRHHNATEANGAPGPETTQREGHPHQGAAAEEEAGREGRGGRAQPIEKPSPPKKNK